MAGTKIYGWYVDKGRKGTIVKGVLHDNGLASFKKGPKTVLVSEDRAFTYKNRACFRITQGKGEAAPVRSTTFVDRIVEHRNGNGQMVQETVKVPLVDDVFDQSDSLLSDERLNEIADNNYAQQVFEELNRAGLKGAAMTWGPIIACLLLAGIMLYTYSHLHDQLTIIQNQLVLSHPVLQPAAAPATPGAH